MTKRKGMRIGSGHRWKYTTGQWNETKIGPRKWEFTYTQGKTRTGSWAKQGQGMPTGSKLIWKGNFTQYAIKTSPNKYKLIMKGTKYRAKYKVPKKRWSP